VRQLPVEEEIWPGPAGLQDFEITWREDVFNGAPQQSSAASFGTLGINFRARKPAWAEASLTCPELLYHV
jgi:hypothetical protein